ncbi:jg26253, partial [Pararge aegeria aegeria]
MTGYFSDICAPGVEAVKGDVSQANIDTFTNGCIKNDGVVSGEVAALLVEGKSDVAFISMKTVNLYQ